MGKVEISSQKDKEIIDITSQVSQEITINSGVCHLLLLHTTAALTIADLDPGTDQDILNALQAMIPELDFRHPHDPSHVPDHIWSAIIGPNLTIPVKQGKLVLGTWQHIVLIELNGPRDRLVQLTEIADK